MSGEHILAVGHLTGSHQHQRAEKDTQVRRSPGPALQAAASNPLSNCLQLCPVELVGEMDQPVAFLDGKDRPHRARDQLALAVPGTSLALPLARSRLDQSHGRHKAEAAPDVDPLR